MYPNKASNQKAVGIAVLLGIAFLIAILLLAKQGKEPEAAMKPTRYVLTVGSGSNDDIYSKAYTVTDIDFYASRAGGNWVQYETKSGTVITMENGICVVGKKDGTINTYTNARMEKEE